MSSQTNLKADDWCIQNQSAAPLEWILQKGQYNNTYAIGTVGINAKSNFVRPDIINIDSYLSGRDDILSKCNPPIPALDEANDAPLTYQNEDNVNFLQPIYTREKASAINLSAISYLPLTFNPDLPVDPQTLNNIIFNEAQRGGIDTSNMIKNAWNTDAMEYFLDPQRACGKECSEVNGYMTRSPYSRDHPEAEWGKLPTGPPSSKWFNGQTNTQPGMARPTQITSQMLVSLGSQASGPQQIVSTQYADPGNPNNYFKSENPVRTQGNPYGNPPQEASPINGKMYYNNPFSALIPR
jgi:hypothetical protein